MVGLAGVAVAVGVWLGLLLFWHELFQDFVNSRKAVVDVLINCPGFALWFLSFINRPQRICSLDG